VFVTFTSLVIAFRTSEALTRYTDGAKLIHTLSASWFDAGSALLAFAKVSDAYDQGRKDEVEAFKETLVRLISLLSALCFDTLQGSDGRQALLAKERVVQMLQEKTDKELGTALRDAAKTNKVDLVDSLIQAKANLEAANHVRERPLHYACQEGHFEVVTKLVEAKGNLEAERSDKSRPLHLAA